MKKQKTPPAWVVKPLVPEPVYTDREEFLDYFYQAAPKAATRRTMPTVMLGQRRMGKTEIFKRVVNRLFFEQDSQSPYAAVPVYFSFPDAPMDRTAFAKLYMGNYIRFYVGFLARQPDLIVEETEGEKLLSAVEASRSLYPFIRALDVIPDKYDAIIKGYSTMDSQNKRA